MCGRYALHSSLEEIAEEFSAKIPQQKIEKRYNAAPAQKLPVIIRQQQNYIKLFSWGLVPSWAKDPSIGSKMINARSETIAEKPSFRKAFSRSRCLVPVNGFYEWKKTSSGKRPVYITPKNAAIFAFAGLWETCQINEKTIFSFTVATTEPNNTLKEIHNRMPVILTTKQNQNIWLNEDSPAQECLKLLRPCDDAYITHHYVSRKVNATYNDAPELIKPVTYPEQSEFF
ncbi:SOS response-associated peptidase [Candidatus Uabimicrobium sp. HlEnr_7]|uniref:SOS response-associated peptidase n=1 Tax=Candidatus Uabimicrobium helgolandensis TaxID=3095367 RepID=UPI00355782B2